MVVAFQTALNAWQDFSTSKVVSSIKGMLPSDVLVFRDGSQVEIPAADLVTGDLVCIAMGEKVPADLRLTKVSGDLLFDRSILTGEVSFRTSRAHCLLLRCQARVNLLLDALRTQMITFCRCRLKLLHIYCLLNMVY